MPWERQSTDPGPGPKTQASLMEMRDGEQLQQATFASLFPTDPSPRSFPLPLQVMRGQQGFTAILAKIIFNPLMSNEAKERCPLKTEPTKRRRMAERKRPTNSTSQYRGVTHHIRTGRWEAHIWFVHIHLITSTAKNNI